MKTFDEAWEVISSGQITEPNMISGLSLLQNEKWTETIEALAQDLIRKVLTKEAGDVRTILCSGLHMSFQLGLLTGMEMEKTEKL